MVVRFAIQGRLAPTWFCTLFEINELQNEILGLVVVGKIKLFRTV
jgi:hypothetical protein